MPSVVNQRARAHVVDLEIVKTNRAAKRLPGTRVVDYSVDLGFVLSCELVCGNNSMGRSHRCKGTDLVWSINLFLWLA